MCHGEEKCFGHMVINNQLDDAREYLELYNTSYQYYHQSNEDLALQLVPKSIGEYSRMCALLMLNWNEAKPHLCLSDIVGIGEIELTSMIAFLCSSNDLEIETWVDISSEEKMDSQLMNKVVEILDVFTLAS